VIADAINGAILRLYTAVESEDGQSLVEYSLIGVLVAVALALTLGILEGKIVGALSNIGNAL
jgi:Flp pilus assembly pilin Flp